jgi:hypothetical protein
VALAHSPRIVTDGLVLCLDAGNTKSYPGIGTDWFDLSGNGNNGSLVNMDGANFNSANGGSLTFDGSNEYLITPTTILNTNIGFTIELWIYINDPQPVYPNFWSYWYSDSPFSFEWGTYANPGGQGRFYFKDSATGSSLASPYIGNQWANITFGCNATIPFLYTNGNSPVTGGNFTNTDITITNLLRNNGGSLYYKASQSSIRFYNRALSASEVKQNFNALRGRFGI